MARRATTAIRRLSATVLVAALSLPPPSLADIADGRRIYLGRCAICHGTDMKGTGPLARKSNPPASDLTAAAFRRRLKANPQAISSSVILRPNGDLIPRTLRENGVKMPPFSWTRKKLDDLDAYMTGVIAKR